MNKIIIVSGEKKVDIEKWRTHTRYKPTSRNVKAGK